VLAADFGFKQAVATKDQNTIISALFNHGNRIDADLMMLTSTEGKLIASTHHLPGSQSQFPFPGLLKKAKVEGGITGTVMLDGKPYQIVIVPVRAPVTVAWASMGFLVDESLADQLRSLTNLEVTIRGSSRNQQDYVVSTLAGAHRDSLVDILQTTMASQNDQALQLEGRDFYTLTATLGQQSDYKVTAVLETSLDTARANFNPLKLQMLLITAIAVVASALVAVAVSRNITRPIDILVNAAQRISSGNYDEQVKVKIAKDEIGELGNSFIKMQSAIAEREEQILYQAHYDALTGLPNRMMVTGALVEQMKEADSSQQELAVVTLNINQFKQVNDTFGHQIGDDYLKQFAGRLRIYAKEKFSVAHLGGDEFLLLLPHISEAKFPLIMRELQNITESPFSLNGIDISPKVTIGIALYPKHGEHSSQLLRRADIALHHAKSEQIGLSYYELGQDEKHLKRFELINDLREAIEQDQLVMYYQPKLNLKERQVTQVESLIRWIHAEHGFIPPDDFIGLAEQSGIMPSLTRWVLKTVVREACLWQEQGIKLAAAVNLSAYDLANDELPGYVNELLKSHNLSANYLILEVTESAVMKDPKHAINILHRLKSAGIKLAIDDFGTGYSSLAQLKSMPVDELKIDKSFVLKLDQNPDDLVIVRSTIELGHNMGMAVIAEGVESKAIWDLLEENGCDMLQGYFISRPLPPLDFVEWYLSSEFKQTT